MSELMPRVLVIEDEPQIRRFVCEAIGKNGCEPVEAGRGRQGLDVIASGGIALVILDLGLPDMDGVDLVRNVRAWSNVPVLVLSARSDEQDKIDALDAGADDYLTKPFGIGELLARLRVLLRRHAPSVEAVPLHHFGEIEVDLSHYTVRRGDALIHLTQIEYQLLAVFLANAGKVLTNRSLMQQVWGPGHEEQQHYVRIYVRRLRQKLENDPTRPQYLLTETGVGYRFQP